MVDVVEQTILYACPYAGVAFSVSVCVSERAVVVGEKGPSLMSCSISAAVDLYMEDGQRKGKWHN